MIRFSDSFIDELKGQLDIVSLISDYVELKRAGKNFKGLCPFHQENTPSFFVNPDNKYYHCFGCGAGGDAINFIMELENTTFQESIKILARRTGMELPDLSTGERTFYKKREKMFALNQLTAKFYHYLLVESKVGKIALDYLAKRGFSREDAKKYKLGFAPKEWQVLLKYLQKKDYSLDFLLQTGLVSKGKNNSYYDKFRNRIIFPIFNSRGEVLAFGGRILPGDQNKGPKYLNSPETLLYSKKKNLYGINWAREAIREKDMAIIMEGYTDVLQAHKNSLENVVASLGTSLTVEQAKLIKRYTDNIYIAYDADTAGEKATLRGLDILHEQGLHVKIVSLKEDLDPDQLIKEEGRKEFIKYLDNAINLVDFKIENILDAYNLADPEQKIPAVKKSVQVIANLRDSLEMEVYLERVASKLEIAKETLKKEVQRSIRNNQKKKDNNFKNRYTNKDKKENNTKKYQFVEEQILAYYITNPELRELIYEKLSVSDFQSKYHSLAEKLLTGPLSSGSKSMHQLQANLSAELKNLWSALLIKQKKDLNRNYIIHLIDKIQEENLFKDKKLICDNLQNENLDINKLNKMLVSFQKMKLIRERRDYSDR